MKDKLKLLLELCVYAGKDFYFIDNICKVEQNIHFFRLSEDFLFYGNILNNFEVPLKHLKDVIIKNDGKEIHLLFDENFEVIFKFKNEK